MSNDRETWGGWLYSWFWSADCASQAEESSDATVALTGLPRTDATVLRDAKLVLVLAPTLERRDAAIAMLRQPDAKRTTEFTALTTIRDFARQTKEVAEHAAQGRVELAKHRKPSPRQVFWSDALLHTGLSRKLKRDVRTSLLRALGSGDVQLVLCAATARELSLLLTPDFRGNVQGVFCDAQCVAEEHEREVLAVLQRLGRADLAKQLGAAREQSGEFLLVQRSADGFKDAEVAYL